MTQLFRGLIPICRKEFLHIVRDTGTLFFALFIPMVQLFLFGFAIDTNVRQIPTVVLRRISHAGQSTTPSKLRSVGRVPPYKDRKKRR